MRIGLEVHVQLAALEKLFSRTQSGVLINTLGGRVNSTVDRLDWACPGVLPVLNMEAVRCALRAAVVLKSTISKDLVFDRKHYKYHDLPLGYQITQKRQPFAHGGLLKLHHVKSEYPIKHIQLEQDTGKTIDGMVDLRRAGNGLIEIVTDPIFNQVSEAKQFCWGLVTILRDHGGITEGKLEEGQVRFDVNVSDLPDIPGRVEVKNLNSYKFIQTAIDRLIEKGHCPENTTFGFDQRSQTIFEMREKKEYVYLPEFNIPDSRIPKDLLNQVLAELKPSRFEIMAQTGGLQDVKIRKLLNCDSQLFHFWHRLALKTKDPNFAYNWAILETERFKVSDYERLEPIIEAVHQHKLERRQAQQLIKELQLETNINDELENKQ